jgi:hypothetical protein
MTPRRRRAIVVQPPPPLRRRSHRNRGLTSEQRGYDAKFRAARRKIAPTVEAGRVACWRCGRIIPPGSLWDLGHNDVDRSKLMGPEHRRCNRRAAAQKRAQMYGTFKGRRTPTAARPRPPALGFFD